MERCVSGYEFGGCGYGSVELSIGSGEDPVLCKAEEEISVWQ